MTNEALNYIWCDRKRTIFGLPWTFTKYFLTQNKFVTRTGLLSLSEDEFDLYKVTDKKLLLPFWQRIVGCGSIELHVRGDQDTPVKLIRCIKQPREVLALLDKQIEAQRDRYQTRGRDLYGGERHYHRRTVAEDEYDGYDDYADDADNCEEESDI